MDIPPLQSVYNLLNNTVLALLIVAGVVAIAIALFSVLASRKGTELMQAKDQQLEITLKNKDHQLEVLKMDANARIEEAKRAVAKIEQDNVRLRSNLATLQADAATAKGAQQKVEIELERQKEKTARAEATLFGILKHQGPRGVFMNSKNQQDVDTVMESLRKFPGTVEISYKDNDSEAYLLADSLFGLLRGSGWQTSRPSPVRGEMAMTLLERMGVQPLGITLIANSVSEHWPEESPNTALLNLLLKSTGELSIGRDSALPDNSLKVFIMQKP